MQAADRPGPGFRRRSSWRSSTPTGQGAAGSRFSVQYAGRGSMDAARIPPLERLDSGRDQLNAVPDSEVVFLNFFYDVNRRVGAMKPYADNWM